MGSFYFLKSIGVGVGVGGGIGDGVGAGAGEGVGVGVGAGAGGERSHLFSQVSISKRPQPIFREAPIPTHSPA